jgi:ribosomal protein S18 acetylase RimI-like enzyme
MVDDAVVVREATAVDFAAVAELTARVYVGEGFTPPEAEGRLRDVAARAEAGRLLVAVDEDGVVIGAGSVFGAGTVYSQIAEPGEEEIRLVAVAPGARGRGTGEALVRALIAEVGDRPVVLSTQPTMEAAQRLYARLGFVRCEERDWKRSNGRPMLAYWLEPGELRAR